MRHFVEYPLTIELYVKGSDDLEPKYLIIEVECYLVRSYENADADGNRGIWKTFVEDQTWQFPTEFEDGSKFDKNADYFDEDGNKLNLLELIKESVRKSEVPKPKTGKRSQDYYEEDDDR